MEDDRVSTPAQPSAGEVSALFMLPVLHLLLHAEGTDVYTVRLHAASSPAAHAVPSHRINSIGLVEKSPCLDAG